MITTLVPFLLLVYLLYLLGFLLLFRRGLEGKEQSHSPPSSPSQWPYLGLAFIVVFLVVNSLLPLGRQVQFQAKKVAWHFSMLHQLYSTKAKSIYFDHELTLERARALIPLVLHASKHRNVEVEAKALYALPFLLDQLSPEEQLFHENEIFSRVSEVLHSAKTEDSLLNAFVLISYLSPASRSLLRPSLLALPKKNTSLFKEKHLIKRYLYLLCEFYGENSLIPLLLDYSQKESFHLGEPEIQNTALLGLLQRGRPEGISWFLKTLREEIQGKEPQGDSTILMCTSWLSENPTFLSQALPEALALLSDSRIIHLRKSILSAVISYFHQTQDQGLLQVLATIFQEGQISLNFVILRELQKIEDSPTLQSFFKELSTSESEALRFFALSRHASLYSGKTFEVWFESFQKLPLKELPLGLVEGLAFSDYFKHFFEVHFPFLEHSDPSIRALAFTLMGYHWSRVQNTANGDPDLDLLLEEKLKKGLNDSDPLVVEAVLTLLPQLSLTPEKERLQHCKALCRSPIQGIRKRAFEALEPFAFIEMRFLLLNFIENLKKASGEERSFFEKPFKTFLFQQIGFSYVLKECALLPEDEKLEILEFLEFLDSPDSPEETQDLLQIKVFLGFAFYDLTSPTNRAEALLGRTFERLEKVLTVSDFLVPHLPFWTGVLSPKGEEPALAERLEKWSRSPLVGLREWSLEILKNSKKFKNPKSLSLLFWALKDPERRVWLLGLECLSERSFHWTEEAFESFFSRDIGKDTENLEERRLASLVFIKNPLPVLEVQKWYEQQSQVSEGQRGWYYFCLGNNDINLTFPILEKALREDSVFVQKRILSVFALTREPLYLLKIQGIFPHLLELWKTSEFREVLLRVFSKLILDSRQVGDLIEESLGDSQEEVREAGLDFLENLRDLSLRDSYLFRIYPLRYRDPSPRVRKKASEVLSRLGEWRIKKAVFLRSLYYVFGILGLILGIRSFFLRRSLESPAPREDKGVLR
jgi:hypothetical protein